MPIDCSSTAKLLAASVFALAVAMTPAVGFLYTAPVAQAEGEGGVPEPEPVPVPRPDTDQASGSGGCQSGESLDPSTGNCVPAMTPIATTQGDQPIEELQPRTTQDVTSTTNSGLGADMVPNINGYPCTGYWMSMACVETSGDEVPVQPKSTLSSSP
jgi:hypothetical protein